MELTKTGRLRRNEKLSKTMAASAKTESNPITRAKQAQAQAKADKLALSQEAAAYLEERNRYFQERSQRKQSWLEQDMQKWAEKTALLDSMEAQLKTMSKCNKIYSRVVKGDRVPPEDLNYLRNNDPEGYKMALAMRRPKKHPKKWESVLDEEDKNRSVERPHPPADSGCEESEASGETSGGETSGGESGGSEGGSASSGDGGGTDA